MCVAVPGWEVNDEMANVLVAQILYLANQDAAPTLRTVWLAPIRHFREYSKSDGKGRERRELQICCGDFSVRMPRRISPFISTRQAGRALSVTVDERLMIDLDRWVCVCGHGNLRCHAVRSLCLGVQKVESCALSSCLLDFLDLRHGERRCVHRVLRHGRIHGGLLTRRRLIIVRVHGLCMWNVPERAHVELSS